MFIEEERKLGEGAVVNEEFTAFHCLSSCKKRRWVFFLLGYAVVLSVRAPLSGLPTLFNWGFCLLIFYTVSTALSTKNKTKTRRKRKPNAMLLFTLQLRFPSTPNSLCCFLWCGPPHTMGMQVPHSCPTHFTMGRIWLKEKNCPTTLTRVCPALYSLQTGCHF